MIKKIKKISAPIYNINEEGLIANRDYANGRLIPAIVISSEEDEYIKEVIKLHSTMPLGDIVIQWGGTIRSLFSADKWMLYLTFLTPTSYTCCIVFSLKEHYSVIDAILQSRGLRISFGYKGDKVSQLDINNNITIEVPYTGIDSKWEKTLIQIVKSKMRKHKVQKKELNKRTKEYIKQMRDLLNTRFTYNIE